MFQQVVPLYTQLIQECPSLTSLFIEHPPFRDELVKRLGIVTPETIHLQCDSYANQSVLSRIQVLQLMMAFFPCPKASGLFGVYHLESLVT